MIHPIRASEDGLDPDSEQSILDPSEVELGETIAGVMERVDRLRPTRVVFDSLPELLVELRPLSRSGDPSPGLSLGHRQSR